MCDLHVDFVPVVERLPTHAVCVCVHLCYLCAVGYLSWTRRSSVFSTTAQTVAPHKTASPAQSSWNM